MTHGRLVLRIEHNLEIARAFKELEPAREPPFENDEAINNLYFLHDRKMNALDHAVYELIKVQDVVNRLLHESLGGDLVDTSKPDWERTELTRKSVDKGLHAKLASGAVSQADFDAIINALDIPKKTPHAETARTYRRRLMHHLRPSVDYAMFFSGLESREGEVVKDASGKITGRRYDIRVHPPLQYRFENLHGSLLTAADFMALSPSAEGTSDLSPKSFAITECAFLHQFSISLCSRARFCRVRTASLRVPMSSASRCRTSRVPSDSGRC
jgi:hypothetical protein